MLNGGFCNVRHEAVTFDHLNLYRIASVFGLAALAHNNWVLQVHALSPTIHWVLGLTTASWMIFWTASFFTTFVRRNIGEIFLVHALLLAFYYVLRLEHSGMETQTIISAMTFCGLMSLLFHKIFLVALWAPFAISLFVIGTWGISVEHIDFTTFAINMLVLVGVTSMVKVSIIKTQSALDEARVEAEEAAEVRTRFLANMSHEIRTPMNGVIGMTEMLNSSDLSPEQRSYVGIIRSSGEQLLHTINEILDFSKLRAEQLELEVQTFSLEHCLGDALNTVLSLAAQKNLTLALDITPNQCRWVKGDPLRLRQVLVNLLSNAVKFTKDGQVSLTVRTDSLPSDEQARLSITVSDTGIGIPAHRIESLFDAFTQADTSTTRQFGGTGLGLSICRSLIEHMGGNIEVISEQGKGSEFRIDLTLDQVSNERFASAKHLTDKQIYLASTREDTRRILGETLSQWQAELTAFDSVEALLEAPIEQADLLIVDATTSPKQADTVQQQWTRPTLYLHTLDFVPALDSTDRVHLRMPTRPSALLNALTKALGHQNEDRAMLANAGNELSPTKINQRALLAEDNPVNQQVAVQILRKLGVEVDVAQNGREAVELATSNDYPIIFMDMQMPVVDGLEATQIIRLNATHRQPYIIAMTANAQDSDRNQCMSVGMNDFVAKPINVRALKEALLRAQQKTKSAHEAMGA